MTNYKTNLSFFNQLRPFSVGFDDMFDQFERMYDYQSSNTVNYPPYNIVKTGDYTYDIEVALAGFGKDDIEVKTADGELTIKSVKSDEGQEKDPGVIHKGISKRQFVRTFTIAEDMVVNGAELKDGLLTVALEKIIPEAKKPKTIQIK
jgi:molecular chaperone IbpA